MGVKDTVTTDALVAFEMSQDLLDGLSIGIAIKQQVDDEFHYVSWNLYCEQMFGWQRENVLGKTDHELFPELKADATIEADRNACDTQTCSEVEEPLISGTAGPVIVRIRRCPRPVDEEGSRTIYYFIEDVTLNEKERFTEKQLAAMTREDPTPILRFSPTGTMLFHNPAAEKLINRAKREADQPLGELWVEMIKNCYERSRRNSIEFPFGRKTYKLTFCPSTEFASVSIYASDITYRKIAERKLLERNVVLQKMNKEIQSREKKLVRSDEELRQKNERLFELNKQLHDHQEQLLQSEKMASVGQLAAGLPMRSTIPLAL